MLLKSIFIYVVKVLPHCLKEKNANNPPVIKSTKYDIKLPPNNWATTIRQRQTNLYPVYESTSKRGTIIFFRGYSKEMEVAFNNYSF
jgi:hypothetical protein